jgi:methylated-DNA-[protein]-cysteine S-methyltransferase
MMTETSRLPENWKVWLGDKPGAPQADELMHALDDVIGDTPDAEHVRLVQERLNGALLSEAENLVYYTFVEQSPIGPYALACSVLGLVAVEMGVSEAAFIQRLETHFGAQVLRSDERLAAPVQQLNEYLAGTRAVFDLRLDLSRLTDFQRLVLSATNDVPRGQVVTYGDIARRIGKDKASRAVGQALARNPVPIVIPCHRVLASDGSMRGYSGGAGVETKEQLLRLEGALLT